VAKLPTDLSGREVRAALERAGFVFRRQAGSHMVLRTLDSLSNSYATARAVILPRVPIHASPLRRRRIPPFTLAVIGTARSFDVRHVSSDPHPDAAHGFPEALAERRELIVDTGRHRGVDIACHKAIAFELAQRLRQHLVADPSDPSLQIGEAELAFAIERLDHQKCPFVGDALQNLMQEGLLFGRKIADCGRILHVLPRSFPTVSIEPSGAFLPVETKVC
jgi:hypothetical protein